MKIRGRNERHFTGEGRKNIILLEYSQSSPAPPSDNASKKKSKAIPVTGRGDPQVCEM
jgi:hypothetical protein